MMISVVVLPLAILVILLASKLFIASESLSAIVWKMLVLPGFMCSDSSVKAVVAVSEIVESLLFLIFPT